VDIVQVLSLGYQRHLQGRLGLVISKHNRVQSKGKNNMLNKLNLKVSGIEGITDRSENERIQDATVSFLSKKNWDHMVTLNFISHTSKASAQRSLDRFIKKLNIRTFGKRSKQSVTLVAALETCHSGIHHYHILLKDPASRITNPDRQEKYDLKEAIRECWESTDSMTANIMMSCPDGESWFKPVTDSEGAVRYITKEILGNNQNVIQYNQFRPDGRRI